MDLQLSVQSVPITTTVVGSNSADDEMYSMQYYVTRFVSDICMTVGFFAENPVSVTNITGSHDIIEIMLKVALHTITL